jgi:endonuclease/exonuclease/phosphatase family metal-dependent hydrolase
MTDNTNLRIVSYNIHKGLSFANRRLVLRAIRDALRTVDPDIVLMQEVVGEHRGHEQRFDGWPVETQLQYLAGGWWSDAVYGKNAVYDHGHHGNAILSKFSITSCVNIDLSRNRFERRGLLHARIQIANRAEPVHVCALHLDLLHLSRKHQIAHLGRYIREAVPSSAPLILGGDFNDWRPRAPQSLMRECAAIDAYTEANGSAPRTYPAWFPMLALDRIYVRNLRVAGAEVLAGGSWRRTSDHLALKVDLHLSRLERRAG